MISQKNPARGLTLIELTIVMGIIGILFTIVAPRAVNLTSHNIKTATRRLTLTIKHIHSEATTKGLLFRLGIDIDTNRYWIAPDMDPQGQGIKFIEEDEIKKELPEGVSFLDVFQLGQLTPKKETGIIYTYFGPDGRVNPPTLIHLTDERDNQYAIFIHPFTGRVEVRKGYEEIELDEYEM